MVPETVARGQEHDFLGGKKKVVDGIQIKLFSGRSEILENSERLHKSENKAGRVRLFPGKLRVVPPPGTICRHCVSGFCWVAPRQRRASGVAPPPDSRFSAQFSQIKQIVLDFKGITAGRKHNQVRLMCPGRENKATRGQSPALRTASPGQWTGWGVLGWALGAVLGLDWSQQNRHSCFDSA